ncbi:hypothetical protein PENNAL_c0247G02874, partial [Penicillium nalgiovense]
MTWGVSTLHLRRMWIAVLLPQISFAYSAWYTSTLARRSDEGRRYGLVSPLKRLETHLKFKGIEVNRLELIRPFAVPPWWQPPKTRIAPDKDTAIKEHDQILRATPLYRPNSAVAYTDGSKTENGG